MIEAGLRRRFISDSVRTEIEDALEALGWFDENRAHAPVTIRDRPADWDDAVEPNILSISMEDDTEAGGEMGAPEGGAPVSEDRITFFADVYGESDAVARHVAWDVHDVVMGKLPSIGRVGDFFDIFNRWLATPAVFVRLDVERCSVSEIDGERRAWQRHWFTVRFDLIDDHADAYEDLP